MKKNDRRRERERQRRRENRETILQAAEAVILRKGFQETSMDDVAAEAEFSKATLYRYFRSKAELVFEIVNHYLEKIDTELRAIRDGDGSVAEKLLATLTFAIKFETEKQNIARVFLMEHSFIKLIQAMIAERGRPGSEAERRFVREIRARRKAMIDGSVDLFRQGVSAGEFRIMDPAAASRFFDAVVEGYFVGIFWAEAKLDIDRDIGEIFQFLLRGIGRETHNEGERI
jgi:AcrR family transcriptional regulator